MTINELLLYSSLFNILFGGYVLGKNRRSRQNVSFGALSIGVGVWLAGFYFLITTRTFYWPDKLIDFGGILTAGSLFVFTNVFPSVLPSYEKMSQRAKLSSLLPLAVLAILLPFNVFVKNADFSAGLPKPVLGPLFIFYGLILSVYVLFSLRNIYWQYTNSAGYKRQRILYVLLGLSLFLICALIFDLFLPLLGKNIFWIAGPAASLLFSLLTAASIISFRLLDIRILLSAIAANVLALAAAMVFILPALHARTAAKSFGIFVPLSAVILFLIFRYLAEFAIQKFFLKNYFSFEQHLAQLNERLRQEHQPHNLLAIVGENLRRALGLPWIFYFDPAGKKIFASPPDASLPGKLAAAASKIHEFAARLAHPHFFSDRELDFLANIKNLPTGILPIIESAQFTGYFMLGPQSGINGLSAKQIQDLQSTWQHIQTSYARAVLRQNLEERVKGQVENIIEKNRRLREEIRSRLDFVKTTTHQLRTPVTALSGALQLLSRESEAKKQKELINMAYQKSKQLIAVIAGILNLAKVEQGNIKNTQEPVDLNRVFANVLMVIGPLAAAKGLSVDFMIQDDLQAFGNSQYLEQAFANILENAVEYTREGKIKIYFMVESDYIIACIADTGSGIPEQLQAKIFNKNMHSSSSKGLGLGLYLVKTIINAHPKGHVWFETGPQGTTFFVRLKRYHPETFS